MSGAVGSKDSCLDSVQETTGIGLILTLEQNSVETLTFSILHCTESRYNLEKLWNVVLYMEEGC